MDQNQKQREPVSGRTAAGESCIPPENLSAELDHEYSFSKAEQQHLQTCVRCRNLYESYRIIARTTEKTIRVEYPERTEKRIRKNVWSVLRQTGSFSEPEPIGFRGWIARIAAMLILLTAAGYLVYRDTRHQQETMAHRYAAKPVSVIQQVPKSAPEMSSAPVSSVDIRNLQLISAGDQASFQFTGNAVENDKSKGKIVVIPTNVRQVWLYDHKKYSSVQLEKDFRTILKKIQISGNDLRYQNQTDGSVYISMKLTRMQTVGLVRSLYEHKFKLVSPEQPQPEQRYFYGTGKEPVNFDLQFIPVR